MTIYNINFGIGWASSGVEYAQSYRAQMLRHLKRRCKIHIFRFYCVRKYTNLNS